MNEWWQSLEQRERILVSVMSVMVIIAMLYWFLLDPLFNGASNYSERLTIAEDDLAWMKRVQPQLLAGDQPNKQIANESLIAIVDRTTQEMSLKTRSVQQAGGDKVRVQFDDSSFESMVRWFGLLHKNHNVVVDTINVTRDEDTAGVVSGTVTIQKAVN